MINIRAYSLIVAMAVLLVVGTPHAESMAQSIGDVDVPIEFSADQLDVDRELGVITARGNVEAHYEDRTLIADTISYDQNSDVLTASGNITLLEPSGEVIFAQHMEISGDLKNGIIRDIGVILSDNARIAASGGRRSNGDFEFRNAVYSPCNLCAEDPTRPPLWQLKAVKVFHDKSRRMIEYSDAWLEVSGVPVLYTPYISHPDPTVKRESGILAPILGTSSSLGFITKAPYFQVIDDTSDATITPVYYGKSGPALETEYRKRFFKGKLDAEASVVEDDAEDIRGHFQSSALFDIDDTWRWGGETTLVSDDTYLRRYNFQIPDDTLTTTLYSEGFRNRNYSRIEGFHFRGLESSDDEDSTPIVLPLMEFQHVGTPDKYGGQFLLGAGVASINRSVGASSTRISLEPEWRNQYVSDLGEVYALSFNLRSDLYHIRDFTPSGQSTQFDGLTGRLFPQAKLDWTLPLVRQSESVHQIIEPMVSLIAAPNGSNPEKIANLDSADVVFDETSLFERDRFAGYDRVDSGSRIDYGTHWSVTGDSGGRTAVFLGQSLRFRDNSNFEEGSGLEDRLSDVVGNIDVSPGKYLDLGYRMQIDPSDGNFRRNEILASAGVEALRFNVDYRQIDTLGSTEFTGRENITFGFTSQIDQFWRLSGSTVRDLIDDNTQSFNFGTTYEDECFIVTTALTRSFYKDRDLEPTDSIMLRIALKTLGEFRTNLF